MDPHRPASDRIKPEDHRAFERAVASLNRVLKRVHTYEPEANYYLANNTLNLMVGPSHGELDGLGDDPHQERVANDVLLHYSSGGDW
jgi:hypothetical protein